ncbi:MAG: LysR family transcriptional regulator [Burkholderiales bacterium]|nr:LysR family transcriptional regulator [Burkholderiales bacterium]
MSGESLQGIEIFVRLAESLSLTAVARRLGISPSGASKALGRLEQRLGVRLVNRTTRKISFTDDGLMFLEHCQKILRELHDAENAVTQRRASPRGHLRIQMPVGFGYRVVSPLLAAFAERHPEIVIDAELSNRVADLAEEGLDAVFRIGSPGDVRLVARKLCDLRYVTAASPSYIKRFGEPRIPQDLARHRCLNLYIPHVHRYRKWYFASNGERFSLPVSGHLNFNEGQALLDAAIAGHGLVNLTSFVVADAIRSGSLKLVLRDYVSIGAPVSIMFLPQRNLSLRVRALVDFMVEQIAPVPAWDKMLGL